MGKPAARVTDMVSNAGMITGPGAPTVLINGLPAARLGDMHTTPMVIPGTPPIPMVGGPIIGPGCPTVLIGGMPAAVMGDMASTVGPPGTIVLGSPNVLIGMAGGGGGGGGGSGSPNNATIQALKAGTIKPITGSESLPIEVQAALVTASKHLTPDQTTKAVAAAKDKQKQVKLTIADFVDVLKGVENEQGKEAARSYAGELDYGALTDMAYAFTKGDDPDPKNDPNQMPTRFMVLYGADDAKLQTIDDHPDKAGKEDHKMNVANLRKALRLMGFDIKETGPYDDELYNAYLNYLSTTCVGRMPCPEKHTVEAGEDLGSIAHAYGLASWKYLYEYDKNKQTIGDNPDLLKEGTGLLIPKKDSACGDGRLKAKGVDDPGRWSGWAGWRYPWAKFSYTMMAKTDEVYAELDGAGNKRAAFQKKKRFELRETNSQTLIASGEIGKSDEIEMLVPDCQDAALFIDGVQYEI